MEFRVLGPLEVLDAEGRRLALGGPKQRALLAVLLLHPGQVVAVERLVDELWGEDPPDTAAHILQVYVANLRKALEPDRATRATAEVLRTQPPGYLVQLGPDQLDLARFERLAEAGRTALAGGDPAQAARLLRDAVELWRGPALAGVVLAVSGRGQVARLEERRLAVLEQRIDADLALGRHADLVGELQALVAAQPLRERLRGQLMLALYRAGRQAEALAAFRQARETLAEELGIDPSSALQRLERAILAQDPQLAPRDPVRHATESPRVVGADAQTGQAGASSSAEEGLRLVACHWCGQENPEGTERCASCGASLALALRDGREERKVLTVLACQLVDPGTSTEAADPEDLRAALAPYQARVRDQVERFGGRVRQIVGTELMAVFGAPVAHEDDAERAVRAALAVRDTVAELDQAHATARLRTQIGIATGEALVVARATTDAGEADITGAPVASAARLRAAARPGTVLVDEATWRATTHAVTYKRGKPVRFSGPAVPPESWQATAARTAVGAALARRATTPFVGRHDELDLLKRIHARTTRESTIQLVTITGEPGVGKSRLLREFASLLEAQPELVAWRQGHCLAYGEGITFWALGEILKSETGILESDDPDAATAKLAAAVAATVEDPSERDWFTSRLAPLVGLAAGGAVERGEAFTAWRSFLEAMAASRPLVLVVEDLHWADEALLAFLEHLLEWASPEPLLLACTARPELYDRAPGWGGGARNATTIALSPLDDEETSRLLAALLARSVLPAELQRLLLRRAEGNPLYAEEFVRLLTDRKLLERRGRTLHLVEGVQLPVPETLHALIAARLDTLPARDKALLQDAAVVGQVFWSGALAAMSQVDEHSVHQALRALARRELVRPVRRSTVAGQAEYAFWHVLVRDVAYGQLPRPARADRHRRAAEWLEALSPDRVEDRAELLAHHWLAALEFARAAGQDTAVLAERARLALRDAGDRALDLNAFAAAARWYTAALDLWRSVDPERSQLLLRLGTARYHAERGGDEVLAEARDGLLAAGDRESAAEAEAMLGELSWLRGQREPAFEHHRRAAQLVERTGPSRPKALALVHLAARLWLAGETEEAIPIARKALAISAALSLVDLHALALEVLGGARLDLGDRAGLGDLERAVAIAVQANSPEAARAQANLSSMLYQLGDPVRSHELHIEAQRTAERFGVAEMIRWLRAESVWHDYRRGKWNTALKVANQFITESEGGSSDYQDSLCWIARGHIRLARGDPSGAVQDADKALGSARLAKDPQVLRPALAFRARALLEAGQTEDAAAQARELVIDLRGGRLGLSSDWLVDLAAVLESIGQGSELRELAARTQTPTPWLRSAEAFARGEFEQAAGMFAELGSLADAAHARLRAAQHLIAAGRETEASEQVQGALGFYRQVRASAYLREAEALLAASA